jgi:hypothetical protein
MMVVASRGKKKILNTGFWNFENKKHENLLIFY